MGISTASIEIVSRVEKRREREGLMIRKTFVVSLAVFGVFMLATAVMVYVYSPPGFREYDYFLKVGVGFCTPAILWSIPWFFRRLFRRPGQPWKR